MRTMNAFWLVVLASVFGLSAVRVCAADVEDNDRPELTDEQLRIEATSKKPQHYRGKLVALTPKEIADCGDPQVIVKLVGDETLLVKAANDKVKALLKKEIGKQIFVNGHRWSDGRFISVISIVPQLESSPLAIPAGDL